MIITGKAWWFKAIGAPQENKYKPDNPRWTFDLSIDDATVKKLLNLGMKKSYLYNKGDDRGTFISFQRDSVKKDGTPSKAFHIVDAQDRLWPDDTFVGNGSVLNVKIVLNERQFGGEKFLKPAAIAIQIWDLIPYKAKGFETKPDDLNGVDEDVETPEGVSALSVKKILRESW